jgi:hypothetical protein
MKRELHLKKSMVRSRLHKDKFKTLGGIDQEICVA